MKSVLLVAVLACSACLQPEAQLCGGQLCPAGTCVDGSICATPEQLAACADTAEAQPCSFFSDPGTCFHGVCEPLVCGDGKAFAPELCDDSNSLSGDGCSGDCRSTEVCGNGIGDLGEQCDDGNLASRDGCTSTCEVEGAQWLDVSPTLPPEPRYPAAAYDSDRGVVVMFGGFYNGGHQNATWELAGDRWRHTEQRHEPPPRTAGAMTFDPIRHTIVLFGGENLNDTWTYDASGWQEQHPAHVPPPGRRLALAFDPDHNVSVLVTGNPGLETWTWDGTDWTDLNTSPPVAPRYNSGLAHDGTSSRMVLVPDGITTVGVFDGAAWTAREIETPGDHILASSIFECAGRLYAYGDGPTGGPPPSLAVLTLDLADAEWTFEAVAPNENFRRAFAAAAYDSAHGRVVFLGGARAVVDRTKLIFYEPAGNHWTEPAPPERAASGTLVTEGTRGRILAQTTSSQPSTWEWDGIWTQRTPAHAPTGRYRFGLASTDAGAVMFGGTTYTGSKDLDETWIWDGDDWMHVTTPDAPTARSSPKLAFDSHRSRVLLFGGNSGTTLLTDTWEWDGVTWNQVSTTGPMPIDQGVMAYDPVRKRVVFVDGQAAATWVWDGGAWSPLSTAHHPPAHSSGALVFDESLARLVFTGGESSEDQSVWTLGDDWQELDVAGAIPTTGALAYDPVRAQVLGPFGSTTWALRFESAGRPPDRCGSRDTDDDGVVGCADPDCAPRCVGVGDGMCDAPIEDHALTPEDCP